jgi:hypothetical protein
VDHAIILFDIIQMPMMREKPSAELRGRKALNKILLGILNYRREKIKRALEELRKIELDSSYEEVKLKLRLEGS